MSPLLTLALSAALAGGPPPPANPPPPTAAPTPDRSTPPAVAMPSLLDHPEPKVRSLAPGLDVVFMRVEGARKIAINVIIHAGSWELDGTEPTTAVATGWLWNVATRSRTPDEIAAEQAISRINLSAETLKHTTQVGLVMEPDELAHGLEMLADVVFNPSYPGNELARYKREETYWLLAQAPHSIGSVLDYGQDFAWYRAEDPFGIRPDLTAIKKLSRGALYDRHDRLLHEHPITITVAGDLRLDDIADQLLKALPGIAKDGPRSTPVKVPHPKGEHLLVVDVPDATQAALGLINAAPDRVDSMAAAFQQVDFALGGAFLSRINLNLREVHGWTYGVHMGWDASKVNGRWTLQTVLTAENLAEAAGEIRKELATIVADGATQGELDACYRDRAAGWNTLWLTAESVGDFLTSLVTTNDTVADRRQRVEALRSVSPDKSRAAAAGWFGDEANRTWVIVGDRKDLTAEITALGLPPTWLGADDAVLGNFDPPGFNRP